MSESYQPIDISGLSSSEGSDKDAYQRYLDLRDFYKSNFFFFCKELLGFGDMRVEPHSQLCDFLAKTPGDGSNRISLVPGFELSGRRRSGRPTRRRLLILDPRGFFKSSICTVGYPIWRWISNPNLRVLIVSHNTEKAREFLNGIKHQLENNKELSFLFGDFAYGSRLKGKNKAIWAKLEIQLWDPEANKPVPLDHTMASCRAVGAETTIAGVHCDICILDDLVNQENVKTETGLERPIEVLKYIENIVNPGGEIIVVGNRYHFNDAYGWLLNNGTYDVLLRGAIKPDGTPLFPSRFPLRALKEAEKNMGPDIASCQLYNNPISPETSKFQKEWIERCIVPVGTLPPNFKDLEPKAYFDFASSVNRRSDYTASVVAVNDGHYFWIIEAEQGRRNVDEIVDEIFRIDETYHPEIGFEANAFQALFAKILEDAQTVRKKNLTAIRPIIHSTKEQKQHRILRLVPLIKSGLIKIQDNQTELITQLMQYPKGHDDLLDALESCILMLGRVENQPIEGKDEKEILMDSLREEMISKRPEPRKLNLISVIGGIV